MRPEDIRKLVGGYATGTLTPEERQALFAAALEDQELFDTLAKEQALREVLEDPAARAHLLAALDDGPLPWTLRFERWLWGHAVGVAAVACFLTVGGYVAWQARDRQQPVLMAEMERQRVEVHESAAPDKAAAPAEPRRAFAPVASDKPAQAPVTIPAPPPMATPSRPAASSLLLPRVVAPPLPTDKSKTVEVAAATATAQTAPIAIGRGSAMYMTRPAQGQLALPAAPATQPAAGRAAGGAVGGVSGGFASGSSADNSSGRAGARLEAPRGARELYDPALAPQVPQAKAESFPAGARGGGGGGSAPPPSAPALADLALADADARPPAHPGVRYQVLRRAPGGAFEEVAAGSDLALGDAVKLRVIPNYAGYLSLVEAGAAAPLLERRVDRLAPVETQEIRVDRTARVEIYALFARAEQPRVNGVNAGAFGANVRQTAPSMLSQAAGLEGVYVVSPAPGSQTGVPFIVTLNFR